MSRLFKVLLFVIVLLVVVSPALGQDVTPEADPVPTILANPLPTGVVYEFPASEVVPIEVLAQSDVPTESITVQIPAEELTFWDVFNAVSGIGALVMVIGYLVFKQIRSGKPISEAVEELDDTAAEELDTLQHNRDVIDPLERAYLASTSVMQDTIRIFGEVIMTVSKYTKSDALREVGEFVDDVITPGAPDDLVAHSSEAFVASRRMMTAEEWRHWDEFLTWFIPFKESGAFDAFPISEPPIEDDDTAFNHIINEGQAAGQGFSDQLTELMDGNDA